MIVNHRIEVKMSVFIYIVPVLNFMILSQFITGHVQLGTYVFLMLVTIQTLDSLASITFYGPCLPPSN